MITHRSPSPEDRLNDYLDALVSNRPAPGEIDANVPAGAARTLRDLANSAEAREQGPLDGIWALILGATGEPKAVPTERKTPMLQALPLTSPNGTERPIRDGEHRHTGWMGRISQGFGTAVVIALLVALVGGVYLRQFGLPATSGDPTRAPALAASPEPSPGIEDESGTDLLVVRGLPADEARALHDRVGVLDSDGLTIYQAGTDPIVVPGVSDVIPFGVPGQAMATWMDASRAVIDLATGERLFGLPDVAERESSALPYLFVTESGENDDWTIFDVRNGESRPLSDIVELPADPPAIPVKSSSLEGRFSPTVYLHFVTPEYEVSPTSDTSRFVIAGSLDRAMTLDGYPPATQAVNHLPVVAPDGESVAWIMSEPESSVIIADPTNGEELGRIPLDEANPTTRLVGFTADSQDLVMTTSDRIILLNWTDGGSTQQVIAEGFTGIGSPLFHAPSGSLYIVEDLTIKRVTIPDGTVTLVDPDLSPRSMTFTGPDAPWIVAGVGGNAAMIDARTGEIVSQLSDVPDNEAEFDVVSLSVSFDGSVFVQEIGGSHSGYLVSPEYPDGLVLTAPIDPDIIAASNAPDGIPVKYHLSADGTKVVAGTIGNDGYTPRYLAQVGPEPEWAPIAPGATNLFWLPMVDRETDAPDVHPLPAQDFATPFSSEVPPSTETTPEGTREGAGTLDGVVIVEGSGEHPRIEGEVAIATQGEAGLTLPLASGASVIIPGDPQSSLGNLDSRLVVRVDGQGPAVIDLVTGEVVHELPEYRPFSQRYARWHMIPTDDSLTDWTIVDTGTGETRLLSEIVDLPGDESVMPSASMFNPMSDSNVFEIQPGSVDGQSWNPSGPPIAHIAIAGSSDRIVELHDYPTVLDRTGEPALVEASEGRLIAYETRAGADRIVVVDTTAGQELTRYGVDTVGEDPILAGFADDDTLVIVAGNSVLALSTRDGSADVVRGGLDDIDNPLIHAPGGVVYLRQGNTLLRLVLESGETSAVTSGIVPGAFGFTKPVSPWIVFQTQEGYVLVDARSGEVVSRIQPPANRAQGNDAIGIDPSLTSAGGDTVIVALDPFMSSSPNDAPGGAVWLLSPAYPDGLEIAGPTETAAIGGCWLSPDRTTLYYWTSESMSGPRSLWATSLGDEPSWSRIAEGADFLRFIPLDAGAP